VGSTLLTGRVLACLVLGAATLGLVLLALRSGDEGHEVAFLVDSAPQLKAGYEVRQAGRIVGTVASAKPTREGRARIALRIDDERAWPLRRGTKVHLRWAGTIRYSGRYVELVPGRPGAPPLQPGESPDVRAFRTVEFDEVVGTFDAATRADMRRTIDAAGGALRRAEKPLRRVLTGEAPEALQQARGVLEDLGADETGLDQLVRSADAVADSAARAQPTLGVLIQGAATSLDAVADESTSLQRTIVAAPSALRSVRTTLGRADRSLSNVNTLLQRLSPGVTELQALVRPLNATLGTIVSVGPSARRTLEVARTGAPAVTALLGRLQDRAPQIEDVMREAARQFVCVRPYAPEVAGFAATWAGFWGTGDLKDKVLRANVAVFPTIPATISPLDSKQYLTTTPQLRVAYPMPPGYVVGKPRFNKDCGVGPEVVTAEGDPERSAFDPLSKKLIEFEPNDGQG